MAFERSVAGLVGTLEQFTTAQLAAFVTQYGPAGTVEVNGLRVGQLVWNTTAGAVWVYNGTTFAAV